MPLAPRHPISPFPHTSLPIIPTLSFIIIIIIIPSGMWIARFELWGTILSRWGVFLQVYYNLINYSRFNFDESIKCERCYGQKLCRVIFLFARGEDSMYSSKEFRMFDQLLQMWMNGMLNANQSTMTHFFYNINRIISIIGIFWCWLNA